MSKVRKKDKKPKKESWWKKHNEECDALRASVRAKAGDGLKLLAEMRKGNEVQRALAATYNNMSANAADAVASLYASNPLLNLLMKRAIVPSSLVQLAVDNTRGNKCPSSEPISAENVSIASK